MKQSEFRYKGKNLGLEKLKILVNAYDEIEDDDIGFLIIDNSGEMVDLTDCAMEALSFVLEECESEALYAEIKMPWHIEIVNIHTKKQIPKSRFIKLFGEALLLEQMEKHGDLEKYSELLKC